MIAQVAQDMTRTVESLLLRADMRGAEVICTNHNTRQLLDVIFEIFTILLHMIRIVDIARRRLRADMTAYMRGEEDRPLHTRGGMTIDAMIAVGTLQGESMTDGLLRDHIAENMIEGIHIDLLHDE